MNQKLILPVMGLLSLIVAGVFGGPFVVRLFLTLAGVIFLLFAIPDLKGLRTALMWRIQARNLETALNKYGPILEKAEKSVLRLARQAEFPNPQKMWDFHQAAVEYRCIHEPGLWKASPFMRQLCYDKDRTIVLTWILWCLHRDHKIDIDTVDFRDDELHAQIEELINDPDGLIR